MATTQEIVFKISAQSAQASAEFKRLATEATASQKAIGTGELTLSQQLKAAESLQRQRSAALISEWKKQETAARNAAAGVVPFHQNLGILSGEIKRLADNLNVFVGARLPVFGGAFIRITENVKNFTKESVSAGNAAVNTAAAVETIAPVAEESAGAMAALFASMGPVGIAAAGIAVELAAVAVGIGIFIEVGKSAIETFFGLAESAAGWRAELSHTSQQLGISVETLSTFEILAKETGSSLDQITASLGIFQKNLEKAQDATSSQGKAFHELKVSTDDTEEALRQTLVALAAMPEGFHQTATALELFGRGGKSILAILKEMHGDLDGAIDRFREMGLIVSREDAEAAHEFEKQLDLLHFQIRALVGKEAIPAATAALEELSRFLKENKGAVDALGEAVHILGLGLEGMVLNVTRGAEAINSFSQVVLRSIPGLSESALLYERIAKATGLISPLPGVTGGVTGESLTAGVTGGVEGVELPKKRTGLTEAQKNAQAELEILKTASQDAQRIAQRDTEGLQQQFAQRKLTLEQYTAAVIELAADEAKARQKVTDTEREQANILPARQKKVELARIALQEQRDQDAFFIAASKAQEDQRKQNEANELALNKQLVGIRDARREGELQRIQDALSRGAILESQAITEQKRIEQDAFNDRMALLDIETKQTYTTAQRLIEIDNERLESQQRFTDTFKRLTQQRLDAMAAEQAKAIELKLSSDFDANKVPIQDVGVPPDVTSAMIVQAQAAQGAFNGLGVAISETLGLSVQAGNIIGSVLSEAFGSLANAVGQAVHSFILFGKVEGGFRRFAAELIASIAASATVQAVYQLAQGLAWLALNAFFPNPKYAQAAGLAFASAAVFGSIAGVATLAGRAVAGNSFNQASGGGAGSSSGGSSGSGSTAPGPIDRTRPDQREELHIFVHSEPGPGWHDNIVNTIVRDVQRNGPTRTVIIRTVES